MNRIYADTVAPGSDPRSLLTALDLPLYRQRGVRVAVLRLDLLHPQISGNKWFKLLPLMQRLEAGERPRVLSFGGVWSNHLHALAFLGQRFGIATLGLVRGDGGQQPTAMLADARRWGMEIQFLSREQYALRATPGFERWLGQRYPDWEWVPEGGSNRQAVLGCRRIWNLLQGSGWEQPEYLMCALGTGGTLAGLIAGKPERTRILGVPVLKLGAGGERQVRTLLLQAGVGDPGGWALVSGDYGGYARLSAELAAFMLRMESGGQLPLDPVYTAKLMASFHRQLLAGYFPPGSRVLLVHTGGLQGRRGMQQRITQRAAAFVGPLSI